MRRTARVLSATALVGAVVGAAVPAAHADPAAEVSPRTVAPGGSVTVSVSCDAAGDAPPEFIDATSRGFEDGKVRLRRVAAPGKNATGAAYTGTARVPDTAGARDPAGAGDGRPRAADPGDGDEDMGSGDMGADTTGSADSDVVAPDMVGPDMGGADMGGADTVGPDAVGPDSMGSDAVGPDSMGSDSMDPGSMDPGSVGPRTRSHDGGGPEPEDGLGADSGGADLGGAGLGREGLVGPDDVVGPEDAGPGAADRDPRGHHPGGPDPARPGSEWGVDGKCPGGRGGEDTPWNTSYNVSGPDGDHDHPGRPEDPGTGGRDDAGAEHGVHAGRGGAFTDSPAALVAGGLLIAGALGAAVHRLYRRRWSAGR
ncbi:hypothetical protein ACFV6E_02295 [Streptomyces sp. NPDC059785]|uniref:hypothetical protein n=1 Tax=unclassified Streptomyces TaxID=2593676 RepID=UPI0036496CA7